MLISFQKNNKKGFTLVEALIAISIVMVAVASVMAISQKSLSSAMLSRDQMIASFLAQDAIEAVKNIRDSIILLPGSASTVKWLTIDGSRALHSCICSGNQCDFSNSDSKYCNIDTTVTDLLNNSVKEKNLGDNPLRIQYDNNTKFKGYNLDFNSGQNSKFNRLININISPDNNKEAKVDVVVSWVASNGQLQTVEITDLIYGRTVNAAE